MYDTVSDEEAVRQVLDGRREVFEVLVRRHMSMAHAIAYAQTGNCADAEDVTQEAFLRAYQALRALRKPRLFAPWLARIIQNTAHTLMKRRHRERFLDCSDIAVAPEAPAQIDEEETRTLLRKHVCQLDPASREVLLLHYFSGKTTLEIAALLSITRHAAKKRLQRARQKLGETLLAELPQAVASPSPPQQHTKEIMGVCLAVPLAPHVAATTLGLSVMAKVGLVTVALGVVGLLVYLGPLAFQHREIASASAQNETDGTTQNDISIETAPVPPEEPFGPSNLPSVEKLLDRCAATQDRIYATYHIKFNETSRSKSSNKPDTTIYKEMEIQYDGDRYHMVRRMWGNSVPDPPAFVPRNDHQFTHWLWDGTLYYIYGQGHTEYWRQYWLQRDKPDHAKRTLRTMAIWRDDGSNDLTLALTKSGKATDGGDYALRGYIGTYDARIDEILREAHSVSLRSETETVAGFACYVLDADTVYGEWTVWIDPDHGCNVAQAFCRRGPGHRFYGTTLKHGDLHEYSFSNVDFREVSGIWVPMKADYIQKQDNADGTRYEWNSNCKRTFVDLQPRFSKDTFTPNIQNGTKARVKWLHDASHTRQTNYTWRNGQVVDPNGRAIPLTP